MVELNRDVADVFRVLGKQVVGQPNGLVAEDEVVALCIFHLMKVLFARRAEKIFLPRRILFEECFKVWIDCEVDGVPIVESGAAQPAVGNLEAKRFHKMEAAAGGGAEP